MPVSLWLTLLLTAVAAPVEVRTLEGTSLRGSLRELDTSGLVLDSPAGEQRLAAGQVQSIVNELAAEGEQDLQSLPGLELADGSKVAFKTLQVSGGQVQIERAGNNAGEKLNASVQQVNWVRFKPQDAALARQWREIGQSAHTADLLVVRKSSTLADESGVSRSVVALDYLEGLVRDIQADSVKFEFEGDVIDVKLEKVEGIFYHRPAAPRLPERQCELLDATQSQWSVVSLQLDGSELSVKTASGVEFKLPPDGWRKIDFSVVNTLYLSELEPEQSVWQDYFDRLPKLVPNLAARYEPRRNKSVGHGGLVVDGNSTDKGLAVFSGTTLTFRLPEGYQRLRGLAGFDDRGKHVGAVKLVVQGDGRELLSHTFETRDAPSLPLDLPVAGVRRLTITVEHGPNKLQTNFLDLCDLRVTK